MATFQNPKVVDSIVNVFLQLRPEREERPVSKFQTSLHEQKRLRLTFCRIRNRCRGEVSP